MRINRYSSLPIPFGRDTRVLEVWTGRICDWRYWDNTDVLFVDTSLKSGEKEFAPTPELLWPYKQGIVSKDEYEQVFLNLTRKRFQRNPDPWYWLIHQQKICLACYCKEGEFCHRHLLKEMIRKLCKREGIQFIDRGEPIW